MGDNLNGIFANMIQGMGFIGCAPNRVYNMAPPDGGGVEATAEGTDLSLHSAAAPLTALTLYGKSEQETTTGAQLIPFEVGKKITSVSETVKCVPQEDGFHIEITGDTTGGAVEDIYFKGDSNSSAESGYEEYENLPSGTYYGKISDYRYNLYVVVWRNGGNVIALNTNTSATFTVQAGDKFRIFIRPSSASASGVVQAIISKQDDDIMYEPYTGGLPSPSPGYPQAINSAGDSGTINVSLSDGGSQSQTLPVQTPNGLPGIPVSSGGNYTDANGQQRICDEVDYRRRKYVKRVIKRIFGANESLSKNGEITDGIMPVQMRFIEIKDIPNIPGLCDRFSKGEGYVERFNLGYKNLYLWISVKRFDSENPTISDVRNWLGQNPITVYAPLENPIETDLSASELSAYAALRTYSPTTVVSNDAGAWMRVGYKATPQPMTMLARKR